MRDISIGEFSLRLADEQANNKVDGDIVLPTQGKRTIYPALIDVQVKRHILLAYPLQYLLCLYNFHFLFSTLLLFSFFNYDSIFNPSRRPQRAPTSEGIGASLLARKKMESLASAVARVAKRRRATTAVPLSAPFCGDRTPSLCTFAKFLLVAAITCISRRYTKQKPR
jgi:hypothetical protein